MAASLAASIPPDFNALKTSFPGPTKESFNPGKFVPA